jgi:hypothetical protein
MKVHVSYTVDVDDHYRRALNHYYAQPGLASHESLREHFRQNGHTLDDDIIYEYDRAMKKEQADEQG